MKINRKKFSSRFIHTPSSTPKLMGGFTLIEMLVALSIFSLIMTIMMGSVLSVLSANRKSQSLRTVMDNLSYTLDDMTRTIRFGKNYHCGADGNLADPRDCGVGDDVMTFLASDGREITYSLDGGRIIRSVDGGDDYAMTSADVTISRLAFYVFGSDPFPDPDTEQPQVILIVGGSAGPSTAKGGTEFNLQTTITQRALDFE
jgi:prepilin-type N-terminal cleavage/methylation domain-containing protein